MTDPHNARGRLALPRIAPEDLRDHADEARVARVWERLQLSLSAASPAATGGSLLRWPVLGAVAASLALGIGIGTAIRTQPGEPTPAISLTAVDEHPRDVYAAGAAQAQYPLPGGGSISLSPGSIVDTVRLDSGGLTLRLIRGAASFSTAGTADATARTTQLALQIGAARVTTAAGSVYVRLSGDRAEVEVLDGSANVLSPHADDDERYLLLGPNQRRTVPVRVTTARTQSPNDGELRAIDPPSLPPPSKVAAADGEEEAPSPAGPAWRLLCDSYQIKNAAPDYLQLRKLIADSGGSSAALLQADSAHHYHCISAAFAPRVGSQGEPITDPGIQRQALERIIERYPDSASSEEAAFQLGRIFGKDGRQDEAQRYFALVKKGKYLELALCKRIPFVAAQGNVDAVAKMAQEYRTRFPHGVCINKLDRWIAASVANAQKRAAAGEVAADAGDGATAAPDDKAPVPEADEPAAPEPPYEDE